MIVFITYQEWLKSLGNQPSFNFDNYINTRIKIKSHDRIKIILQYKF